MMKLFRRYILGGKSDKRELPLLAFLVAVVWGSFVIWKQSKGIDMGAAVPMVGWFAAASLGTFATTASMHHLTRGQGADVPGQGPQGGYPEDGWASEPGHGSEGAPGGADARSASPKMVGGLAESEVPCK